MKIKVVKMTGNDAADKETVVYAFSALVAEGYSAEKISTEEISDFIYDAYSAGGYQENLERVTVLIARL